MSPINLYKIGTLTRTHGVRGEVAFLFTDDVWDRVEADYLFLVLDGLPVPFFLEEWRFRSDSVALLKFEDIDDVHAAEALVGADVLFPADLTPADIDDADLEWRHFTGFEVILLPDEDCLPAESSLPAEDGSTADIPATARLLGTVASVFDQTENVLLDVETTDGRSVLIPAHEDFILRADHRERRLYVCVPDDILTLNS